MMTDRRRERAVGAAKVLAASVVTTIVILGAATALGGEQRDLADRVDRNAAITRERTAQILLQLAQLEGRCGVTNDARSQG